MKPSPDGVNVLTRYFVPGLTVSSPTPGKASRYLVGFGNFEAITRYNRSTFYASAVLDLADAIRTARNQQLMARAVEESQAP